MQWIVFSKKRIKVLQTNWAWWMSIKPKKVGMKITEIVGMAILQMIMNIFTFLLLAVIFKLLGAWTAEFDTLILLLNNISLVDWELTSSFATKTTNTRMGNRSPCISQTSMSLKEELSGSFSWIPSYSVYITRLDVSATIINESKWLMHDSYLMIE